MHQPQSAATPTTPVSTMPGTPTDMPLVPQQLQFGHLQHPSPQSLQHLVIQAIQPHNLKELSLAGDMAVHVKHLNPLRMMTFPSVHPKKISTSTLKLRKQRWWYEKLTSSSADEQLQKEWESQQNLL